MKIQYQDYGAVANIVITSTVFEFRKHNRVVDATLLCTPSIIASRSGMFLMKTLYQVNLATCCVHIKLFSGRRHDEVFPPVYAVWPVIGGRYFRGVD